MANKMACLFKLPLLGIGNQGLSADEIKDEWSLETTVNVRNSTPGTYFMSVGWQPAGYGGIQDKGEERVVIFSMWNGGCGFGTSGERQLYPEVPYLAHAGNAVNG